MKNCRVVRSLPLLLLLAAAAALVSGRAASADAARDALSLCARIVIPSLFPYMVVSSMTVSLGAEEIMGRPLRPLLCRILRLPDAAAGAFLLGTLCGFPIGVRAASALYARGKLTKEEAERLAAIANNVSPAFLVGVVGAVYWHSAAFGALLYAVQLLAALLIGAVYARSAPRPWDAAAEKERRTAPKAADWAAAFTASVGEAASSVVTVCGFVVFFSCLFSAFSSIARSVGLDGAVLWAAPFFEMTAGVGRAAAHGGSLGLFLTGFAVGWGGLSVCAQAEAFAAPHGLSLRRMLAAKLLQGCVTGAAACTLAARFPAVTASAAADAASPLSPAPLVAA